MPQHPAQTTPPKHRLPLIAGTTLAALIAGTGTWLSLTMFSIGGHR